MSEDPALNKLKQQIQDVQKKNHPFHFKKKSVQNLTGQFFNVGVELVAGVLVGVGFGLFIDWLLGTSPWGLISLFILGSAAGMLNVYRHLTAKDPKEKEFHD